MLIYHKKEENNMGRRVVNILDRFYSNLKELPDGCIKWTGTLNRDGYGDFHVKSPKTHIYAHIFAFILYYKREPFYSSLHHKCGYTACCNPLHLKEMTRIEHATLHRTQKKS
jgi:hypothetical protein